MFPPRAQRAKISSKHKEQLVATCQLTNPPALGEERGETPPQLTQDRPKLHIFYRAVCQRGGIC